MNKFSLCLLPTFCAVLLGCNNNSNGDFPEIGDAGIDAIGSIESSSSEDSNIPSFPEITEDEFVNRVFSDGFDFETQGRELLELIKAKSKLTFENLNTAFAEGTVAEEILECSQFEEGNVLHQFSCIDARDNALDTVLLTEHGFPMFLVTTLEPERCMTLPLGAFNEVDCTIASVNFLADSGLYGYYQITTTSEGSVRESLTITRENLPTFVDPSFLPESCIFELNEEGSLFLNHLENCTISANRLFIEFRS